VILCGGSGAGGRGAGRRGQVDGDGADCEYLVQIDGGWAAILTPNPSLPGLSYTHTITHIHSQQTPSKHNPPTNPQSWGLLLGAVFMNPKTAQTVASIMMLTFMLVGGFYVRDVPIWIQWTKVRGLGFRFRVEWMGEVSAWRV